MISVRADGCTESPPRRQRLGVSRSLCPERGQRGGQTEPRGVAVRGGPAWRGRQGGGSLRSQSACAAPPPSRARRWCVMRTVTRVCERNEGGRTRLLTDSVWGSLTLLKMGNFLRKRQNSCFRVCSSNILVIHIEWKLLYTLSLSEVSEIKVTLDTTLTVARHLLRRQQTAMRKRSAWAW